MIINKDLCNNCGSCLAECPKTAIYCDDNGDYLINPDLCNECSDYFEIECIRVCEAKALSSTTGKSSDFDPTWRLRSGHLIWLLAMLGARGSSAFPIPESEAAPFRRLISQAYLNPDFNVRMVEVFDENCIGCLRKQSLDHQKRQKWLDDHCFAKLGISPGVTMKLWEIVELAEKQLTVEWLRELNYVPEDVLYYYQLFVK